MKTYHAACGTEVRANEAGVECYPRCLTENVYTYSVPEDSEDDSDGC